MVGRPSMPQRGGSEGAAPKVSVARKIFRGFLIFVMLCTIAVCIAGCYIAAMVFDQFDGSDAVNLDLDVLRLNYSTIVYAKNPETDVFEELKRLEGHAGSRIWVDYDQLPEHLVNALIAVEDKRFREHTGVDWKRTLYSAVNLVGQKLGFGGLETDTPGGSTLTQQLVRNITDDKKVSVERKLREIFRAIKVEREYSKDQIIEAYMNIASFANNTNGVQAAANLYFSKDASDLTVAESASIVGITQEPTYYDPFVNYENNQKRKETVLFLMHQQGFLSDEEYEKALAEKVEFKHENNTARLSQQQSYFMDYMMNQVIEDLSVKLGITKAEASNRLYNGGYRIYTTVDSKVQADLEEIYTNPEKYMPAVLNEEYPQSAFVVTDTGGAIKGLVGGIGKKEGQRIWSRATDTKRQPGSTIKPISTYVIAAENDLINWSQLVLDGPYYYKVKGSDAWQPRNYYKGNLGYIPVVEALQRSTNLVPVRLQEMISPGVIWEFLHNDLNMKSLVEADKAPSPMSLGALTEGVTPMEMAGAYQMFSNGGMYTEPYTYTLVLDAWGNEILRRDTIPKRVISYETATLMNKLLQKVVDSRPGTGTTASLYNMGIPVAGKTGTTDDDVDQWFIGVTPYYVGVCWMGYDDQFKSTVDENGKKKLELDSAGNTIPNSIRYRYYPPPILWKTVMQKLHEGKEPKEFFQSSNVVSVTYCQDTGYLATENCTNTATGWYKTTNIPPKCPMHSNAYDTNYVVRGYMPWLETANPEAPLSREWAFLYKNNPLYRDQIKQLYPDLFE